MILFRSMVVIAPFLGADLDLHVVVSSRVSTFYAHA